MGGKVCPAPSELGKDGGEAGSVVHDLPAITEDDGDAVGRLGVVAGDAHDSGFGEGFETRVALVFELGELLVSAWCALDADPFFASVASLIPDQ